MILGRWSPWQPRQARRARLIADHPIPVLDISGKLCMLVQKFPCFHESYHVRAATC